MDCELLKLRDKESTSSTQRIHLLLSDPLGHRLCQFFPNGWQFIYVLAPVPGEKPEWKTETRYPLEPRKAIPAKMHTSFLYNLIRGQCCWMHLEMKGAITSTSSASCSPCS